MAGRGRASPRHKTLDIFYFCGTFDSIILVKEGQMMIKRIGLLALCALLLSACGSGNTSVTIRHDTITNPGIEQRHAAAPRDRELPVAYWRRLADRNGVESMLTRYYSDNVRWNCKGSSAATFCTRGYPYGTGDLVCRKQPLAGQSNSRRAVIVELVYICRQQGAPRTERRRDRHTDQPRTRVRITTVEIIS